MTNYSSYPRFFVSVDCVVFAFEEGKLKVLIHKRPYEPGAGELSLIGGFVEKEENLETSARRILKEYTGLDNVFLQQIAAFGEVERDPGERVVSIVYSVLIDINKHDAQLAHDNRTKWVDVDELPKLCLDHNEMVEKARQMLGESIKDTPVAGYLLPQYFTISTLLSLYEAILHQTLDSANFRRQVTFKPYMHPTEYMDKVSSRRGAVLYEFDLK